MSVMKKVLYLLKLFIFGACFSYSLLKLRTDAADFCYKCDERCRKPPLIETCNKSIDTNPMCIAEKNSVNKTEKRSCAYPSRDKEAIYKCNSSNPEICRVCPQNLCNVPKRHMKGSSKCYYCQKKCKKPLETRDCFFIENGCLLITAISSGENQNKSELIDLRKCVNTFNLTNPNQACEEYKKSINSSGPINCTVCESSMCNRLSSDPPYKPEKQKTPSDGSFIKSWKFLLGSLTFILIFFNK